MSDSRLLLEKAPNSSGLLEMDSTSPAAAPRTEAHLTQSGTKRLRTRQACRPCHLLKAKCSGSLPACQRCNQKGIPCEYASSKPSSGTRKRRRAIASGGTQQNHPLLSPLISPKETASAGYSLQALPSQRTRIEDAIPHGETHSDGVNYDSSRELGVEKCVVRLYIDAYFDTSHRFVRMASFTALFSYTPGILELSTQRY